MKPIELQKKTRLYQKTHFVMSAPDINKLPNTGSEIAFVGRSNAGKSSALNRITQQKHLARWSKQPGRTQCLNLFRIDESAYFVDLPGYGYAAVAKNAKEAWQQNVSIYLQQRSELKGLLLLMDSRHPLKPMDSALLSWACQWKRPVVVLLTKADKLSHSAKQSTLNQVKKTIVDQYDQPIHVIAFSTITHEGVSEVRARCDHWFDQVDPQTQ